MRYFIHQSIKSSFLHLVTSYLINIYLYIPTVFGRWVWIIPSWSRIKDVCLLLVSEDAWRIRSILKQLWYDLSVGQTAAANVQVRAAGWVTRTKAGGAGRWAHWDYSVGGGRLMFVDVVTSCRISQFSGPRKSAGGALFRMLRSKLRPLACPQAARGLNSGWHRVQPELIVDVIWGCKGKARHIAT